MPSETRELKAFAAALGWAACTWAALGTVALTAAGTSSRIGLFPPFWILGALAVLAFGLVFVLRLDRASASPFWLALVALLPWVPGPIPPAFLVFAGPIGVFACGAGFVLVVLVNAGLKARHHDRSRAILQWPLASHAAAAGVIAACLYGAASWRIAPMIPGGDEPHYLIITQSLLSDGDLRIENNHARRDYLAYVGGGDLKPDYLKRGRDGAIYSIHAPGLALLVLPAFALGGYVGVTIFLLLLSATGSVVVWRTAYRLTGDPAAAWVGWAGVTLSAPFFFQAFTIYPDGPAALLVLIVVAGLVPLEGPDTRQLIVSGAALAALPWLHTRYAALSAALGLVVAISVVWPSGRLRQGGGGPSGPRDAKTWIALFAIPLLSAVLWLGMFKWIYGTIDPRAPYGGATDEHLSRVPIGLTGLLLDQQFGLIPNAPIYLIALAGMPALYKRHRRLAIALVATAMPYMLAVAGFHMWWAGHSSPARFLVPVLLPCALPIGAWWARHPTRTPRTAALILLAASITIAAVLTWHGRGALLYNVRDGYALLLDWAAPAVNLAHSRPSLFQTGVTGAWARAFGWMAAVALAWWLMRTIEHRNLAPGRWALASGLVAVLAILIGVTSGWAASGLPSLEPGSSVLRMTAASCDAHGPVAALGSRTSSLIAPDASRRALSAAAPLWGGRDVPPGRYTVILRTGLNATGTLSVGLGRPDLTLKTCSFSDARPGRSSCAIDLPAGATSLWLTPDDWLRRTVTALDLEVLPANTPATCGLRAGRAVTTAAGTLFVVDGNVYAEPTGAWVIARATGRFVAQASSDRVRLLLRNGQAMNTVAISSGDWHDSLSFAPGESREIVIPRNSAGISATVLTIQPAAGFRPADKDPTSRDVRELGVWVELRP